MDMARVESVIKRYRSSEAGLISGAEVMVDANPYLGSEYDDFVPRGLFCDRGAAVSIGPDAWRTPRVSTVHVDHLHT